MRRTGLLGSTGPLGDGRARMALALALALALAGMGCGTPAQRDPEPARPIPSTEPALGIRGMVATAHPIATRAGLEILETGGNAFDAAVAVAATLNVVEPQSSGMGGYGTILVHDAAGGASWFLNCSGRIPRGVDTAAFRAPTPGHIENRRGPKGISTPAAVPAWQALSERFGSLEWSELFAPAIRAAEEGFPLGPSGAFAIERSFPRFPEHARAIFGQDGEPLREGQLLVQTDLGRSLRILAAEGASAMRDGLLAQAVDRTARELGSFLRLADLEQAEGEWWEPVGIPFMGYEVLTASPPATSFPGLIRLGMMGELDPACLGHNTADYLHQYAEVSKHAFWCRLRYAGDPEIAPPPLELLLSRDYWQEQVQAIDGARARPFVPPGLPAAQAGEHTTHFVVADAAGNVVSATVTLGNSFGAAVMPEGTGFWLNNSLQYCTFEPAGNPMDAHPGRRKLSGDFPCIVLEDGRPWLAIGTPGGHTISQTVPQMVLNVLAYGMDVQAAISAPRISFAQPDRLLVESGIDPDVRAELLRRGHQVEVVRGIGNAHGLTIEYDAVGVPDRFLGASDPRGAGLALGR